MRPSAELTAFSKRLGYDFQKPELLIQAMTHSSLSSTTRGDNQRFEFLGDRVLGLSISDALFHKDSDASEGLLAPRFNAKTALALNAPKLMAEMLNTLAE